jgi:hypothetical protein
VDNDDETTCAQDHKICPASFGNDARRLVGQESDQAHVRNLVAIAAQNPLTFRSKETATHRCDEDAIGHRKGVGRRFSTPQIVFGGNQCAHQTLRRAFLSNNPSTPLTDTPQQSKDIEDQLESLIPWLEKLKDSMTKSGADSSHEEAERRDQLTRFAAHPHSLVDQS